MDLLKCIGAVVTDAVDVLADASHRLALVNRLKAIERAEKSKAQKAYIRLGRYLAEHLPEDAPAELFDLCEAAATAEENADLARHHICSLTGKEPPQAASRPAGPAGSSVPQGSCEECGKAPCEEEAPAEIVCCGDLPAQETVSDDMPEEAAEDENDGIPFM